MRHDRQTRPSAGGCAIRRYDVARLKAEMRRAALARGIDPVDGSTEFQAALVRADARKRGQAAQYRERGTWWRQLSLWEDSPPDHSTTEATAIRSLQRQCGQVEEAITGVEAVREVLAELRQERSLRELHTARGARADYVQIGQLTLALVIEPAA